MKTKGFLLCLLFLMLGTTTAFADKYYKARYSYASKHRVTELKTDGTKYMIYNTAFNGTDDYTGFLYNNDNNGLGLWKSKDSGIFIYNDCFVFTLEDAGDDNANTFYIKSEKGVYVDAKGNPSTTPVKLCLYTWDEATNYQTVINQKDTIVSEYSVDGNGVVRLNENNGIKQAFVRSEHPDYTVISENQIKFNDNKVFIICSEDKTEYWSGNKDSFIQLESGHPFAFYDTDEVTSVGSFDITDLHIFSRCDLYSAQQIYGYIKDASQIKPVLSDGTAINFGDALTTAAPLLDGDNNTFAATDGENTTPGHAFEIDLEAADITSFRIYMQRRANNIDVLTEYELQVSTDGTNFTSKGTYETTLGSTVSYNRLFTSSELGGSAIKKIRIVATKTSAMEKNMTCMGLAELYVLPDNDVINSGIQYFDSSLPIVATEAELKEKIEEYNMTVSAVKLLSGVPIPGNKYRIYADAYNDDTADDVDNPAYVNRDVSIAVADDVYSLVANTRYHAAGDNAGAFEWYCEETSSGKIVLRNVKYPTKYLANGAVSDTPYEWQFSTNYTQRHGVPLVDNNNKYLTLLNDGTDWVPDIGWVQNQKKTLNCTDFVFLPVELTGTEKQITIIASELATRNAKLTLGNDTKVYGIPFSRIFTGASDLPVVVSTAYPYHQFLGFYKKGTDTKVCDEIDADIYTNSISSGDTLVARFQVNNLFVKSTNDNIILYRIKNAKNKQIASQQSKPHRADVNVDIETDEGGGQVSASEGVNVYVKFAEGDKNLDLVYTDEDKNNARTLFYFTNSQEYDEEEANVLINSAITTKKFKEAAEWTDAGQLYFVQPNLVAGDNKGFTISGTKLNASNNPGNAWVGDFNTNIVSFGNAENEGAAWIFEAVEAAESEPLLKSNILETAGGLLAELHRMLGDTETYDVDRVNSAIKHITGIVGTYDTENKTINSTNATMNTAGVTVLVGYAQIFHILEHELKYAMQKFPALTKEPAGELDKATPDEYKAKWYYVKNVYGTDFKGQPLYAKYNGADNLMKLSTDNPALANLFYFSGDSLSNGESRGYNDEYLKVHVHNFMAQNLKEKSVSNDSTLVSDNNTIFTVAEFEGSGTQNQQIAGVKPLKNDIAWEITAEFENTTGTFSNGWGTSLLATGTKSNDLVYDTGFQVFLKQDGRLVIKAGDSGNNDIYVFTHTQNAYSHLKVVLSYADKRLKVYVTNSQGLTQTIINACNKGRDYIPCDNMADITQLCAYMPKGVFISEMAADAVSAMRWNKHSNNAEGFADWYIHPSSNTEYVGLAVTVDEPDDSKLGWANSDGEHDDIFMDMGTSNYATWQFERVTDFTGNIKELLDMYNVANCVIYNKELYELHSKLAALSDGEKNEATFNAMVELIKEYGSPDPSDYKAPKPGKLYTIRPVLDGETNEGLMVHVDKSAKHSTNEIYKSTVATGDGNDREFDSRGVWMFEGTADGEFLALDGLKLKNIHTQTYITGFGNDATILNETGAGSITLAPLGAKTYFKVGNNYMAMSDYRIDYSKDDYASFWTHVPTPSTGITDVLTNYYGSPEGQVYSHDQNVTVQTAGNVIVTFRHVDGKGNHKQNILGVELKDGEGNIVYSDYHKGSAGNSHTDNIYTLEGVAAGEYTLHCYVYNFTDGDKINEYGGYINISGYLTVDRLEANAKVLNIGDDKTTWFVEEIENPESKVYYSVTTSSAGHATLMLGFPALIPAEVEAFRGVQHGPVGNSQYISMLSYGEPGETRILPAETPVVVRNYPESAEAKTVKFYYRESDEKRIEDEYFRGSLYYKVLNAREYDDPFTAEVETGDVNIYMLQTNRGTSKMYWIYEEAEADGTVKPENDNTDNGGYVVCSANKAYMILPAASTSPSSFSLRFANGGATDVEEVFENENTDGTELVETIYDLQGRRLSEIKTPGIYIINGKKVLVK